MNILILSEPSFPRHHGGAGRGTHLLATGLRARGHRVTIVCQCDEASESETIEGVDVHRLNWDHVANVPGRRGELATVSTILAHLGQRLRLNEVDVLFDSGGFLSFYHQLAFELKQRYSLAFVLQFRYLIARHLLATRSRRATSLDADALGLESAVDESSQCFPVRFADEVLCVSNDDADYVQAQLRPLAGRPQILPEPVEPLHVEARAVARMRTELLGDGEHLICFGGRIDDSMKGGDAVRFAFERVLAARPRARLLLLGQDSRATAPYRRFGSALVVHPWIRDRLEMATVLAAADVLLMPSTYEPFGTLCAEAMQVGTPVVATRVGGLCDQIEHGHNGYLVTGADAERRGAGLAANALSILSDPALAQRLSQAGVESARRFAIPEVAARAELLFARALERARAAPGMRVSPPSFSSEDQARYLALLAGYAGQDAPSKGARVLEDWSESARERCGQCTRSRLAEDTRNLLRLRKAPFRLIHRLRGSLPMARDAAIACACPLGLLQKHDV